jgi:hypothetical protein
MIKPSVKVIIRLCDVKQKRDRWQSMGLIERDEENKRRV